jgi:hypothetical protein
MKPKRDTTYDLCDANGSLIEPGDVLVMLREPHTRGVILSGVAIVGDYGKDPRCMHCEWSIELRTVRGKERISNNRAAWVKAPRSLQTHEERLNSWVLVGKAPKGQGLNIYSLVRESVRSVLPAVPPENTPEKSEFDTVMGSMSLIAKLLDDKDAEIKMLRAACAATVIMDNFEHEDHI